MVNKKGRTLSQYAQLTKPALRPDQKKKLVYGFPAPHFRKCKFFLEGIFNLEAGSFRFKKEKTFPQKKLNSPAPLDS